jgi:hypothetical protein
MRRVSAVHCPGLASASIFLQARELGDGPAPAVLSLHDIDGANEAKPSSDGRVVLDDIDWDVVSQRMGCRSRGQCMEKWYEKLSPSMVAKGELSGGDCAVAMPYLCS